MSDEIKPRMVGVEAVCDRDACPSWAWQPGDGGGCEYQYCMAMTPEHERYLKPVKCISGSPCAPYYRARVAELEAENERLRQESESRRRVLFEKAQELLGQQKVYRIAQERTEWGNSQIDRAERAEAERDKWMSPTISLNATSVDGYPFKRYECRILDVGFADRIFVIECPELVTERDEARAERDRLAAKVEARCTYEEVALWLAEYHGRYREITLMDWVRQRRAALAAAPEPATCATVGEQPAHADAVSTRARDVIDSEPPDARTGRAGKDNDDAPRRG